MKSKIPLILGLALIAASANGQTAPAGSGTLSGGQRIGASGCGKDTGSASVAFNLAANGAFSANASGDTYTGTSTTMGRVTRLALDAGSLALLEAVLESDASDLCEESVAITSLSVTQSTLKVNKRQTAAKLQVKARGTGTSTGGGGTGKFRLKAVGPWQIAQP
jgi:hypothetical protein